MERQRQTETDRHTDRQIETQGDTHRETEREGQTERQRDGEAERDRQILISLSHEGEEPFEGRGGHGTLAHLQLHAGIVVNVVHAHLVTDGESTLQDKDS